MSTSSSGGWSAQREEVVCGRTLWQTKASDMSGAGGGAGGAAGEGEEEGTGQDEEEGEGEEKGNSELGAKGLSAQVSSCS